MSIPATQMRPGMIIKHNNDLHSVFSVEHRTPGNLRAFIQAKLRNLRTGAMFEHRFRSPDPIEKITVDEVDMQFLYSDGDSYYFMDTANYEQTYLTKEILGDAVEYLIPNLEIKVEFFDGKAVGIELPQTVILTVVETEPGLKSATASSVTKAARRSKWTRPRARICHERKPFPLEVQLAASRALARVFGGPARRCKQRLYA
jgi:elongation factor P